MAVADAPPAGATEQRAGETVAMRQRERAGMELAGLLRPREVAIIGASDRNPWSGICAGTLKAVGYDRRLHLINKRGSTALGRETVRSCSEATGADAALLAVPAAALGEAIEDMAAGGVRYGAVVSSGFAETGREGAAEQQRIFARAQQLGLTLLGPNSLGFVNFIDRVAMGAIPVRTPLLDNPRVGLVSQSGATTAVIAQAAHQQNVSLSYMVALGNEAMVGLHDVLHFLVADPSTRSIAVFAETIRNPEAFLGAARAAAAAGKAIVMLKVGTGELTATVAQAHTGALVGDDRIFQAICDELGVIRVRSLEDLVITADLLAAIGPIAPDKGLGIVSMSGGACEVVADRGEEAGISFPQFGPDTLARLSGVLADFGAAHNPIDITGAAMARPAIYGDVMRACAADPQIGLIGVIAELPNAEAHDSPLMQAIAREIAAAASEIDTPVVVIQQIMKPFSDFSRNMISDHVLPLVTGGLDHAIRAIGNLFDWSRRLASPLPERPAAPALAGSRPMGERETLAFLAGRGVPVIPQHLARSAAEAADVARRIGGKLALKILSPDIPHKSDAGGVMLDVAVADAAASCDAIVARVKSACPDARLEGVLVSPMRRGGTELIVGVARDPVWGLALAVGLGGIWVEVLKDSSTQLLPVTGMHVREMIGRLKARHLLEGYRGAEPADIDRLVEVIVAIGDAALALGEDLAALEVNPLRVDGAEIEALDALAIWKQP